MSGFDDKVRKLYNSEDRGSKTNNNNNYDSIIDIDELRSKINNSDFIKYAVNTVKKTVVYNDTLIKQILYTGLSSYTHNYPITLAVLSPKSQGKGCVERCLELFLEQDIIKIGSMSIKSLIKQIGILVDSNNQPVEGKIKELFKLKRSLEKESDKREEKIDGKIKDLFEDSKTLIDLTDKILVFLEPPSTEIWSILNPILLPSSSEIEFPFENQNIKDDLLLLQLKKVVIRGNPACIFCVTKDEFKLDIWPNIQSQFLISSPNMISQKYQESTKLISPLKGSSNSIKEQTIVSEKEIQLAKECILAVKHIMKKFRCDDNNEISVWIPYSGVVREEFLYNSGIDMRFKKRIFSFLRILLFIRYEQRKLVIIENDTFVIAELKDLKEVLSITQNFEIPIHIKEFFEKILYPCYKEKKKPDFNADGSKKEEIKAVTTKQLCEFYKKVYGKSIDPDILEETFLNELLNNELIDCENSIINPRQYIYYPLVEPPLFSNAANTNSKDNHNNQEGRASIASKSSHFDQFSHNISPIYVKITKKTDETWLFYEIMQLISNRIDPGEIKGPLADFLNNNYKFWISDNKQSGHNNDSQSRTYLDNKLNPNSDIENESSILNTKQECDVSQTQDTQQQCCCNKKSSNLSNKLTIKKFIQSYTDFSKFQFDAHQSLKWSYFTKTSQILSKVANFDAIDATDKISGNKSGLTTVIEEPNILQIQNLSSLEDPYDISKSNTSNVLANETFESLEDDYTIDYATYDNERLIKDLEQHPLIGYREPFYYCKEHPEFKNINSEEILLHMIIHKDHQRR